MRKFLSVLVLLSVVLVGCKQPGGTTPPPASVTLYTSVDQPVAQTIIDEFTSQTGITVRLITDTEATKSAGLASRLLAEKANPQADVFWGNEVFHTINLAKNGVLTPYESPEAKAIPAQYKDAQNRWAGSCLRARVIAVPDDGSVAPAWAKRLEALTDPALKNRAALARPTAGTTGGHVSAMYALWGKEKADDYFRKLHANGVKLLGGNSVVAEQVGNGQLLAGLTDNDDVDAARKAGGKVVMHLPDQGDDGIGTLTIPCTVALVAGRPASDPAKKLVDYLLGKEVEAKLIERKFGQYSVRAMEKEAVKPMQVSYETIAEHMSWAPNRALAILEGREVK